MLSGSVAAALALSACGGSSSSGSGGTKPSGPVTMGVLSCFTGNLASLGQAMLQGSQVAMKAINDAGGILGQQLQLQHADTQCDEADSVPALRKLLATSNLTAIIGPETQEIAADAPILTSAKVHDEFQGGSTLFDHNTNPWLWRDSPSDSQLSVAMALYAHKKGYKNQALLFYSDIAAQTFAAPLKATSKKLGDNVVADITVAPDQTSYRTQVQQIIAAKPDVIFTQTDAATAAVLFQNFKELDNLAIPFIGTDVTGGDDYLKAVTYPVAHDHLISVYGTSVTGQAADEFTKQFNAVFGSSQQPLANANYAYDSVVSVALAADQAQSIAGADINANMKKVTNPPGTQCYTYKTCLDLINKGTKINYDGASGDLNYNQYNNVFGPYGAFQVDASSGQEQQVQVLTAPELAAATP
ncbi:MAG TPA: ABC transporter substrate-binding protein [Candidatus Limnocylindrales bacterium]|nr:ABC transporter substrate-binding protein [Candidatus Limnocylindrales bacterium]